jgi:hypothetical protein
VVSLHKKNTFYNIEQIIREIKKNKMRKICFFLFSNNLISLTGLQDRQRAPLKHSRRCLENYTMADSFMSVASDEEVDYGSFDIDRYNSTHRFGSCIENRDENDNKD